MFAWEGKGLNISLDGSSVRFKKRPPSQILSPEQEKDETQKKEFMRHGISLLRKMRHLIFSEKIESIRQQHLKEAHAFADSLADYILQDGLGMLSPTPTHPFVERVQKIRESFHDIPWESSNNIPLGYPIKNLQEATQDILIRIEELRGTSKGDIPPLSESELISVLQEFLVGTNGFYLDTTRFLFSPDTKIGGILSGGLVYLLIVKKIIERYGQKGLQIHPFAISVNKDGTQAHFEESETDASTQYVYIVDDVINTGKTIFCAWNAAGKQYPEATIRSQKGVHLPGAWKRREVSETDEVISALYYDCCDLSEEGRPEEALALFHQAEAIAQEKGIRLMPGWFIRKGKIDKALREKSEL